MKERGLRNENESKGRKVLRLTKLNRKCRDE